MQFVLHRRRSEFGLINKIQIRRVLLILVLWNKVPLKSRNNRLVWVGRVLKDYNLVPTPLRWVGHLPVHQGAQSSIQAGIEHLRTNWMWGVTVDLRCVMEHSNMLSCFQLLLIRGMPEYVQVQIVLTFSRRWE